MRKRRHIRENENVDRWVISYADFITLLFAFFTTMYAISHVDAGKLEMFAGSMKSAFKADSPPPSRQIIEGITPIPQSILLLEDKLRTSVSSLGLKEGIAVRKDSRGVIVSLGDYLLFDAGQSTIKENALPTLVAIASVIRKVTNDVVVEGHTDNVPLNSMRFASNWELSTSRATNVLNYFLKEHNLSPQRFSAAGYAEFKPIESNATPDGRAKNRRVDIVVLRKDFADGKI